MFHPGRSGLLAALTLTGLLLALPLYAGAHVRTDSGAFRVTMGWGREPALSGSENFVGVSVADRSGAPVRDPGGSLAVEVSFGDARTTLPLVPVGRPGEFQAVLVPTRPGVYAFHVTGTTRGRALDVRSTCSERTFDCVIPASEVQFPTPDPTRGETAQVLSRALSRADRARDRADGARRLALGAIALAAVALALAAAVGLRARRRATTG